MKAEWTRRGPVRTSNPLTEKFEEVSIVGCFLGRRLNFHIPSRVGRPINLGMALSLHLKHVLSSSRMDHSFKLKTLVLFWGSLHEMAWKRGTQNNLPGEIRKGHIKEFLFPSLKKASVSYHLRIFELPDCEERRHSATALVSSKIPECFVPFLVDGTLFIHSHDHPRSVLKVFLSDDIPEGHIVLNEIQRINSKVCIGELQEWTIYQGWNNPGA